MKRHGILNDDDIDVKKYYIVTRPTRLSELDIEDLNEGNALQKWQKKSRDLQMRRWRKIKHQQA